MSDCTNKGFQKLLHAYELDLLEDHQKEQLELHIMECESCQEELKNFVETINTIDRNSKIVDLVNQLADDKSESAAQKQRFDKEGRKSSSRPTFIYALVATAAILLFLMFKPWDIRFAPTKEAIAQENRVVIIYFKNLVDESDPDNLGKILSNLLISDLSESQYLQVVPSQHVDDILKLDGEENVRVIEGNLARDIADKANAKWMIEGNIVQVNPKLVLTVQLINTSSGKIISAPRFEALSGENMFSLVDRMTVELKKNFALPEAARDEPDPAIANITTNSPEAYQAYLKGVECVDKLYFKEAHQYYKKAIEYDSTFAIAYRALVFLGDKEMLKKAVKYSYKATRKEQLYINSLEASMSGNTDRAKEYLKELIRLYPDEKIAVFELATYAIFSKDYDEAFRLLNDALKIDPLYKMAYNEMVYLYDKLGNYEMAMEWANKYIAMVPDEPNPYDTRGEIYAKHGKLDKAIESYEKAYSIKHDFTNYNTLFTLGRLFVYKGDYARANELFQEAILEGDNEIRAEARTYLALVWLYRGDFEKSLQILNDGIAADRMDQLDKNEYSFLKYITKAEIFMESHRFAEAGKALGEAEELHEGTSPVMNINFGPLSAVLLIREGDTLAANKLIDKLKGESSKDSIAEYTYCRTVGLVKFYSGDFAGAAEWLKTPVYSKIIQYPDSIVLGQAYLNLGEYEIAKVLFENIQNDYFNLLRFVNALSSAKVYYYFGLAYENTNTVERAKEHYSKFLDIMKDADPRISEVQDARDRLNRLQAGT